MPCLLKDWERKEGLDLFQQSINRLVGWAEDNGMFFNPAKSHLVMFSRLRKAEPLSVSLNGAMICKEPRFKYLGLSMDSKLNFVHHVTEIKNNVLDGWLQSEGSEQPLGLETCSDKITISRLHSVHNPLWLRSLELPWTCKEREIEDGNSSLQTRRDYGDGRSSDHRNARSNDPVWLTCTSIKHRRTTTAFEFSA